MVTVTYHCPRCGAVAALERGAYLSDKCVTADPLESWEYTPAYEAHSAPGDEDPPAFQEADGVELVCGAAETRGDGCGEPYYLSFVKFDAGEELDPPRPASDGPNFDFL